MTAEEVAALNVQLANGSLTLLGAYPAPIGYRWERGVDSKWQLVDTHAKEPAPQ